DRAAFRVDSNARLERFSRVDRRADCRSGDCGGRHVDQQRAVTLARGGEREGIGAESRAQPTGRRDLWKRIAEREADHPALGRAVGVIGTGPQEIAVVNPDYANAMLLREIAGMIHRELSRVLTEAICRVEL